MSISHLDYVPLSDFEDYLAAYLALITGALGIPVIIFILALNLPYPNIPSAKLLYTLCFADLLFCGLPFIQAILNLRFNGWSTGSIGCYTSVFFQYFSGCLSVASLSMIAAERYLSVCHRKVLDNATAWTWIAVCFVITIILSLIPFFTGSEDQVIVLASTKLLCMINWAEMNPVARINQISGLTYITTTLMIIVFSYSRVLKEFKRLNVRINQKALQKEKEVGKCCMIITIIYGFCTTPYSVRIIYEMATSQRVSPLVTCITDAMSLLNSALNPYLLMYLDNRIKGSIKRVFKRCPEAIPQAEVVGIENNEILTATRLLADVPCTQIFAQMEH